MVEAVGVLPLVFYELILGMSTLYYMCLASSMQPIICVEKSTPVFGWCAVHDNMGNLSVWVSVVHGMCQQII